MALLLDRAVYTNLGAAAGWRLAYYGFGGAEAER
jgi:hypothetical protein